MVLRVTKRVAIFIPPMHYLVKTPWWLKKLFPSYEWSIPTKEKRIYLTFDDGPHPQATPFVLDELKKFGAQATFFCIGKNVVAYPEIYKRILEDGHAIGNHTYNHLNGWKSKDETYTSDIASAANYIDSNLFRPPYGRITSFQAQHIHRAMKTEKARIIMWSVLSGDFDTTVSAKRCIQNVILNATKGSIVVFHDSEKAFPILKEVLPAVLQFFYNEGYNCSKIKGEE
ncbi:MAG TPA: polysaccharide deacetylase family protein [Chitinophagaceae bacterium]